MLKRAILAAPNPIYTLSGTTGSPIMADCTTTATTSATAQWQFQFGGAVVRSVACSNTNYQTNIEWVDLGHRNVTPDIWIRATQNAGSSVPNAGGPALNTWWKLHGSSGASRTWGWFRGGFDTTPGTYTGSIKIELSRNSSGTDIVATGFYGGTATVNP